MYPGKSLVNNDTILVCAYLQPTLPLFVGIPSLLLEERRNAGLIFWVYVYCLLSAVLVVVLVVVVVVVVVIALVRDIGRAHSSGAQIDRTASQLRKGLLFATVTIF